MTDPRPTRSPGADVSRPESFPSSVVGVQTAVPAFIGYTQKAESAGKVVLNQPIGIGSLAEFEDVFGAGFERAYTLEPVTDPALIQAGSFDFQIADPSAEATRYYALEQATGARFNLYDSLRLFYANGGGHCFVVSVGTYLDATGNPVPIAAGKLQAGLDTLREQTGPTLLAMPDAVLLPNSGDTHAPWTSPDFQQIARAMLSQCAELQDRMAILDVYGTEYVTPQNLADVIRQFRTDVDVSTQMRGYGIAYFPFLATSVVPLEEIHYTQVADASRATLQQILGWHNADLYSNDKARFAAVQADIDAIAADHTPEQVAELDQNLSAALPLLVAIKKVILASVNTLPPSSAMAGVFTRVDQTRGVWEAPANVSLSAVEKATFPIDSRMQEDLNVPIDGKAINAIRDFAGRGAVVWGARTLDGNSNDYRYIQVRRTLIYIEQSIRLALHAFVFAANDANTWTAVVSMVSNFLQGIWSQGGLMGATAAEAFSVQCGLGSTMTGKDIVEGYMIVQVTLQMIRPAEFIELTFRQKLEG
jgi:hypothetical protein